MNILKRMNIISKCGCQANPLGQMMHCVCLCVLMAPAVVGLVMHGNIQDAVIMTQQFNLYNCHRGNPLLFPWVSLPGTPRLALGSDWACLVQCPPLSTQPVAWSTLLVPMPHIWVNCPSLTLSRGRTHDCPKRRTLSHPHASPPRGTPRTSNLCHC